MTADSTLLYAYMDHGLAKQGCGQIQPSMDVDKCSQTMWALRYVGAWVDDNMHGQGTKTSKSGKVQTGRFENDKFVG